MMGSKEIGNKTEESGSFRLTDGIMIYAAKLTDSRYLQPSFARFLRLSTYRTLAPIQRSK